MSLFSKIGKFARSPQGRRAVQQAQRYAQSPEGKRKLAQVRQRLATRGKPR